MISDISLLAAPPSSLGQPISGTQDESRASELAAPLPLTAGVIQPVQDVPAYLLVRQPVADCRAEEPLLITLPRLVRAEVCALCRACHLVLERVQGGSKVQPACVKVIGFFSAFNWPLKTFRPKYDAWAKAKDWLVLVNRAKAGAAWVNREFGLPDVTLDYVAARVAEFKRSDALPSAIRSLHRQWQTGFNHRDLAEAIPGLDWANRNPAILPAGFSVDNLRTQLKKRAKYLAKHKALLQEGRAAARAHVPQVRSTRAGLRFLEEVQFDDVKCDFRVFNTATGQPEDLWLLVAHDRATAMLLGFGLRPARVREDGSQEHLTLRDMKQLCGWLLERYGLPPYCSTWKIEHGTATLNEGTAAALMELLPERIKISYSAMIGGRGVNGYLERALGNSKGKASLESHNRQMHMLGSHLPGQTGMNYGVRPKDLAAREKECVTLWNAAQELPAGLRERLVNEFGYPLLTLPQARHELVKIFSTRNSRTDHNLEGFEKILVNVDGEIVSRMESPAERAHKLRAGLGFDAVSPEIIAAFYEHTQRSVTVTDAGEIEFSHEGRKLTFASAGAAPVPGTRLLAYYHPDDPRFLHVTDGRGAMIGTWLRRALVKHGDREALAEAMRYQVGALNAAQAHAEKLNAGEIARLAAMREKNNQLLAASTFIDVTEPGRIDFTAPVNHPVAAALTARAEETKTTRRDAARRAKELERFECSVDDLVSPAAEAQPETKDDFSPEGLL